ncbi:hypothetical protein G647_05397 [Cladophialophora carrionii CBS 160.54]|uniref:Uncharacterized protein n=1 Tax=Cladophialophora carrionii CBS 160.54 TaxID=1279043 RepID=V9D9S6_9EURO|nr:uncharacterized protein G647_05397 [Cladophialophora carrionii CBS 160.54]ETI23595.1 hypothetical protein G647_05397 [Cladophialophora carrionii CBS 160.54]
MNRYRTLLGLGPQRATTNTVCQKCLKKDKFCHLRCCDVSLTGPVRHYSYECKASVQERPYASRPSRTQQLSNPKLVPKLASDTPNNLLNSKGVADQQLAEVNARRSKREVPREGPRSSTPDSPRQSSDSDSISTVSTNRSRPLSRSRSRGQGDRFPTSGHADRDRSTTPDAPRKRRHRSISSSYSRSPRSPRREPGSHRKSRRYRTISPVNRGRPSSMRRGSHRSRSNSPSMDKSQITRQRKSFDGEDIHDRPRGRRDGDDEKRPMPQFDFPSGAGEQRRERKQRSPSPYSKRLALTQAMNM